MRLKTVALIVAAGGALVAPFAATAQHYQSQTGQDSARASQTQAAADANQDVSQARAEERAGYATHDPAKIATARARARTQYSDAWGDRHGRDRDAQANCERRADANNDIAQARAEEGAAYASHDPAKIAAARARARIQYSDAWGDTHRCGRASRR